MTDNTLAAHRLFFRLTQFSSLVFAICLMLLTSMWPANAQTANAPQDLGKRIGELTSQLDQAEKTLGFEGLTAEGFSNLSKELSAIREEATKHESSLTPLANETKAQIDALTLPPNEEKAPPKEGEAPAETAPTATEESEALKAKREKLTRQYTAQQSQLTLIKAILVRTQQLQNRITLALEDRFTRQLFERSGTILNPLLWARGLSGLGTLWDSTLFLANDWFSFLSHKATDKIWQVFGMALLVAILIIGPLRYLLYSGMSRLASLSHPTALQKSSHALWSIIVYTTVPFASMVGIILVLRNANLIPLRVEQIAELLVTVVFLTALSYGILRALLAPQKPNYRLLNLETPKATKLFGIGLLLIATYTLQASYQPFSEVLIGPLETTILVRGFTSIIAALLIWAGLRLAISGPDKTAEEASSSPQGAARLQSDSFMLPGFILLLRPIIWLSCIIIIAAPILGYVSLGSFLAEQLARIFVTLALLGILTGFIDNFLLENLDHQTNRVQQMARSMGLKASTLSQMGVLLNGALRILLYCLAALLIFAPWGWQSADLVSAIRTGTLNLQFGDLKISPIGIMGAIFVFVAALVLVKGIQRWMEKRLLPSTNLDPGLKNSLHTSVGYVGFIIAVMLAFSYLGIDLSNLALVAGALSVGIGFGLQSIVNNFVSGLILLVERPIKTGDWVVVGSDQGYVKKISVRATKIETFDKATVIVPNSDLISNRVMNWMHNGSMGRIIIPLGVSYDADPEQVKEILLRIAEESEHIASYPAPSVYFMDFGASSLDFQLRCYIQNIDNSLSAKSALRFAIFKAMKEAKIEIPFPQQDIHVRSITSNTLDDREVLIETPKRKSAHKMSQDEVDLDGDGSDY
ncbi:MAG: DUF3772 domain-containing protein [Cohaesibacter sp.]|jgi:small-conductance mechanosensitive channel|nr:DUF3772 domain-containing protein [Cohaesibacter sp.]